MNKDFMEEDRQEAKRFADAFIEEVNADHTDVIRMSRDMGCRIRDHIETLRMASPSTPVSGAQEFEEEAHKQIESHLAVYGTWRECNCRIHRAIRVGNSDCPGHEFPAVKEGE